MRIMEFENTLKKTLAPNIMRGHLLQNGKRKSSNGIKVNDRIIFKSR